MLFVLSGPSGVGKTTLGNALLERFPRFRLSVSHTTRPPRGKEQDGVHYHFVSDESFTDLVDNGAFAEHAGSLQSSGPHIHDNRFGLHAAPRRG